MLATALLSVESLVVTNMKAKFPNLGQRSDYVQEISLVTTGSFLAACDINTSGSCTGFPSM